MISSLTPLPAKNLEDSIVQKKEIAGTKAEVLEQGQIFIKIKETLAELFELDAAIIMSESRLYEDLDLDSIDAVDLIVQLQKYTGKKMSPQDFHSVRTVGDIVDAVEKITA